MTEDRCMQKLWSWSRELKQGYEHEALVETPTQEFNIGWSWEQSVSMCPFIRLTFPTYGYRQHNMDWIWARALLRRREIICVLVPCENLWWSDTSFKATLWKCTNEWRIIPEKLLKHLLKLGKQIHEHFDIFPHSENFILRSVHWLLSFHMYHSLFWPTLDRKTNENSYRFLCIVDLASVLIVGK